MTTFTGQPPLSDEAEEDLFGDLSPDTQEPETTPVEPVVEPEVEPSEEEVQPPSAEPAAPEGTQVEAEPEPAAETTSEAPTSEDESVETLKAKAEELEKRYKGLRASRDAEHEAERTRAEQAEQMLATLLSSTQDQKLSPEKLAELTSRAEEAGLDPASVGIYADITKETVDARTQMLQEHLVAQAQADQRRAEARQAAAERELVAEFISTHPDLVEEKRPEMARMLHDIGAAYFVDASGNEVDQNMAYEQKLAIGTLKTYEPLTGEILDIAYEAVTQQDLGTVLRAFPQLYESDEGMQMARRLASDMSTQPAPAAAPKRDVDKALADAQTLGGPSAPAPPPEEELFIKPSADKRFSV